MSLQSLPPTYPLDYLLLPTWTYKQQQQLALHDTDYESAGRLHSLPRPPAPAAPARAGGISEACRRPFLLGLLVALLPSRVSVAGGLMRPSIPRPVWLQGPQGLSQGRPGTHERTSRSDLGSLPPIGRRTLSDDEGRALVPGCQKHDDRDKGSLASTVISTAIHAALCCLASLPSLPRVEMDRFPYPPPSPVFPF